MNNRRTVCPHCHQPLGEVRAGVRLPALKAAIFDAIAAGGQLGVTSDDVIGSVYQDVRKVKPGTIKSHVSQINDLLAATNTIIRNYGGRGGGGYNRFAIPGRWIVGRRNVRWWEETQRKATA